MKCQIWNRPYAYDVTEGRPRVLGVKWGTVTCAIAKHAASGPTPACHTAGPGRAGPTHWLRGWERQRSSSTTRARSATSLDPQHGVVVIETWRQCIRSIVITVTVNWLLKQVETLTSGPTLKKLAIIGNLPFNGNYHHGKFHISFHTCTFLIPRNFDWQVSWNLAQFFLFAPI